MVTTSYLAQLRQNIIEHFNEDELRTLCFDLGVDYDSLLGRARDGNARELVARMDREDRIPDLVQLCHKHRPQASWPHLGRIFVAYKRHIATDAALAQYLNQYLSVRGYYVFIDTNLRTGTKWLEQIDREIQAADFMVVLLSNESADSEMIQAEVLRAANYRRQQGYPQTLPVRMNFEELLPYAIDVSINPLQYVVWENEGDNDRIAAEILAAMRGHLPDKPLISIKVPEQKHIGTDGNISNNVQISANPLPQFDPRSLHAPGGAMRPSDKFYIRRTADDILERELMQRGTTVTIRAPRQTGKTSLLMRGLHFATQHKAKAVFFDLQNLGEDALNSPDIFLREFGETIAYELGLDMDPLQKSWQGSLSPQKKLTYFLEDHVLKVFDKPIILAIDEADGLLQTEFYRDFFGMLRSWHNRRALYEVWEKLHILLVISTEPYLLIDNINQSPFNVGQMIELQDFTVEQVAYLNTLHPKPIAQKKVPGITWFFGGHPFLTRQFFYKKMMGTMARDVLADNGPFGSHLRRLYWAISKQPELQMALRQIIETNRCQDERVLHRLLSAGLIRGSGTIFRCRCELYQRYFKSKLL